MWLFVSLHKSKQLVLSALEVVFSICGCGFVCLGGGAVFDTARSEWLRLPLVGEVEGKTATLVKEVLSSV